eukprot:scaffold10391_cov94-Isochrysis_galbana.AAC.6
MSARSAKKKHLILEPLRQAILSFLGVGGDGGGRGGTIGGGGLTSPPYAHSKPDTFPRHTADMLPLVAHVRAPPRLERVAGWEA